ncbi:hypothetical protein D3C75_1224730 [compost metagenome]
MQLGAVRGDNLVDDALGFLPGFQVRVVLDQTAKLGLIELPGGVVEDQPLFAHVEFIVFIMGNARLIRRSNIDHRHTITSLIEPGIPFGDVNTVRQGGQQRLPS